jgi:hypothetical protein
VSVRVSSEPGLVPLFPTMCNLLGGSEFDYS